MTKETLSEQQYYALFALERALVKATDSGLCEVLLSHVRNAESINDFAEGVSSLRECLLTQ
jgi:hypothetical protein